MSNIIFSEIQKEVPLPSGIFSNIAMRLVRVITLILVNSGLILGLIATTLFGIYCLLTDKNGEGVFQDDGASLRGSNE